MKNKIKTRKELKKIVEKLKKQGKKIGFTCGAFDILHSGHVDYLEKAKKFCDILIVGVNSDSSVKEYKGEDRPIIPEKDRIKLISALEVVDYAFLFKERRQITNLEELRPHLYIKAGDYKKSQLTSAHVVEKYGGKAVLIPPVKGISTSDIINKITSIGEKERIGKKLPRSKAVFIDRDGTINKDTEFLSDPKKFIFEKNAIEGLKLLSKSDFKIIITTNQAGIGIGYFRLEDFYKVNRIMLTELSKNDVLIDKIYFCPHSKKDNCDCIKPKTGMLKRAVKELNIDLKNSYVIGDKTSDIKFGKDGGCKAVLVETGKGGRDNFYNVKPDFTAKDLKEAANYILNSDKEAKR